LIAFKQISRDLRVLQPGGAIRHLSPQKQDN
jgi:hypothetical protein